MRIVADRTDAPNGVEQHAVFYAVAYTAFLESKRLDRERREMRHAAGILKRGTPISKNGPGESDADLEDELAVYIEDALAANIAAEDRAGTVAIVFSAITLEAFINYYALENVELAQQYFSRYLEWVRSPAKWLIFPWMIVGEAPDAKVLERVKSLFAKRNKLAHFTADTPEHLRRRDAESAVRTVHRAVVDLAKFDTTVDTRWLSEVEKAPPKGTDSWHAALVRWHNEVEKAPRE